MLRYFVLCLLVGVTRATVTDEFGHFITRHVQNQTCRQHTLHVLHAFSNLEMWAVQMIDASAKLPAGIMDGNLKSLGHYDQCIKSRDHLVTAQYCLVNVHVTPRAKAPARTTELLKHLSLQRYGIEYIGNRSEARVPDLLPILSMAQLGVCVPDTCDTQDVAESMRGALQLLLDPAHLMVDVHLLPNSCYVKESPKPWTLGQIFISCLVIISLLLCIIGTFCDEEKSTDNHKGGMQDLLQCFSAKKSWQNLTSSTPNSITCLDGLRVINTFWVIFGHKVIFRIMEPVANNSSEHYEIGKSLLKIPMTNALLSVDSFLMMSAMLKSQQILNSFDKGNFNARNVFLKRFFRLSPAYYFIVLFYATVLTNVGNGPAWNKFVHLPSQACSTNWFWNFIYAHNYMNSENMCILQSWYLAVDMQLHLIAPIMLYAIWYFARNSTTILMTTLITSTIVPFYITYVNNLPPINHLNSSDDALMQWMYTVYFPTHARATSFTVGLGLGYIFYKTQNKQLNMSKTSLAVGWFLSILTLSMVLFGAFPLIQFDHKYNAFLAALFSALSRPGWALGLAWIVFSCHKGYGGIVNRFLSSQVFQPFSRLSYCVYLTHFLVIMVGSGNARSAKFIGDVTLAHDLFGDLCFTLVFALILHLLIEAPCSHLITLYFHQRTSTNQQASIRKDTIDETKSTSILDSTMDWIRRYISAVNKTVKNIIRSQSQNKYE